MPLWVVRAVNVSGGARFSVVACCGWRETFGGNVLQNADWQGFGAPRDLIPNVSRRCGWRDVGATGDEVLAMKG